MNYYMVHKVQGMAKTMSYADRCYIADNGVPDGHVVVKAETAYDAVLIVHGANL